MKTALNAFLKGYLGILLIVVIIAFAPELQETGRSMGSLSIHFALCAGVSLAVFSIFYFVFRCNRRIDTGTQQPDERPAADGDGCEKGGIDIFRYVRIDKLPHIFIAITAMLVVLYPEKELQTIVAYGFRLIGYFLCVACVFGMIEAIRLSIKAK